MAGPTRKTGCVLADRVRRGLSISIALLLTACATVEPVTPPVIVKAPIEPPIVVAAPAKPAPRPAPEPLPPPPPPTPEVQQVAVLLTGDAPAYRDVADQLAIRLGSREAVMLPIADERMVTDGLFRKLEADGIDAIVAVGLPAARIAGRHATIPVIFCQVFDVEEPSLMTKRVRGVSALPPLDRQLDTWLDLDPGLRSVGALLGTGHAELVAEAEAAALGAGLEFRLRQATSDREALYLFRRMAPEIDGLWLFPDNRILSPAVIKEMLDFALRRRIRVVVFTPALLGMGAFMSAGASAEDIARVTVEVLDAIATDNADDLPRVSPLNDVDIRVNPVVARRLGLEIGQPASGAGGSP